MQRGHFDVLLTLHGYGAVFDQVDSTGNTPVHYAAKGFAMCCKFLAQRGNVLFFFKLAINIFKISQVVTLNQRIAKVLFLV